MKKTIALLLMLSMLLTLCACGSAAPAAGTGPSGSDAQTAGESEAQPEAEAEKTYVEKKETLLTRRIEKSLPYYKSDKTGPLLHEGQKITEYSYDEYGAPSGESIRYVDSKTAEYLERMDFDDYSDVILDDAGRPRSMTVDSYDSYTNSYTDFTQTETATFDGGQIVRIEWIRDQSGKLAKETEREFYPNGALKRETIHTFMVLLFWGGVYEAPEPMESVWEYREDGRCERMHTTSFNEDYMQEYTEDAKWEYNDAGDAVHLDYERSDGYAYSLELQYDEMHRVVSGSKAFHGVYNDEVVEYAFRYDEDGRLIAAERRSGDTVLDSSYEYDENGFLTADRGLRGDGSRDDVLYTWEKGESGWYDGTISPSGGRSVFTASSGNSEHMFNDRTDDHGNLTTDYVYSVEPSLMTLEPVFVEREVQNEYERRDILVEADPEELAKAEAEAAQPEQQAVASPEDDYYPQLSATYCGVPVPTPSGQERLTQIVVEDLGQYHVRVVTDFHYDEDGRLTEIVDSFDPVGSMKNWTSRKADEQGRLIECRPSESWGITYVYGDDADSYTMISQSGDNSLERVIRLEEEVLSTWIKKPAEELMRGYNPTISEEGLVLKTETKYADGTVYESNYEYSAETYDGGALKAVLRRDTEYDSYSYPVMEFDEDGYLTYYNFTGYLNVYYYYDYT